MRAREDRLKALLVAGWLATRGPTTRSSAGREWACARVPAAAAGPAAGRGRGSLQETLLAIHNQRHTFDPAQPLSAWVHAIAKYKLIDALRRRARRDVRMAPLDDAHAVLAATEAEPGEARRDLAKLLDSLPARQRLPIVSMKIEGLSVAETARRRVCQQRR